MNQQKNKIVIWSLEPLERGGKIHVSFEKNNLQWQSVFDFNFSGNLSDKEFKNEVEYGLSRFYHLDHNFKITFKKLMKKFEEGQRAEWNDICNGKSCHYIYLRDPIIATVKGLLKIINFLCRIRI